MFTPRQMAINFAHCETTDITYQLNKNIRHYMSNISDFDSGNWQIRSIPL